MPIPDPNRLDHRRVALARDMIAAGEYDPPHPPTSPHNPHYPHYPHTPSPSNTNTMDPTDAALHCALDVAIDRIQQADPINA